MPAKNIAKPIRMDRKYETREGDPATILCVDCPDSPEFPVVAMVDGNPETYTADGRYYSHPNMTSEYDLVEVEAPAKKVAVKKTVAKKVAAKKTTVRKVAVKRATTKPAAQKPVEKTLPEVLIRPDDGERFVLNDNGAYHNARLREHFPESLLRERSYHTLRSRGFKTPAELTAGLMVADVGIGAVFYYLPKGAIYPTKLMKTTVGLLVLWSNTQGAGTTMDLPGDTPVFLIHEGVVLPPAISTP